MTRKHSSSSHCEKDKIPSKKHKNSRAQGGERGLQPLRAIALAAVLALMSGSFAPVCAQETWKVSADWDLNPLGDQPNKKFRLLFITSTQIQAISPDIEVYHAHARTHAAIGHAAIREYSSLFRVIGCTADADARTNGGIPPATNNNINDRMEIYWLNGPRLAEAYRELFSGAWKNHGENRDNAGNFSIVETGEKKRNGAIWTGCQRGGVAHMSNNERHVLGDHRVSFGTVNFGTTMNAFHKRNNLFSRLYALSPVFEVADAMTPVVKIDSDAPAITEGDEARFTITVTPAPANELTVNLTVEETGSGDYVASSEEGGKSVTVGTSGTASFVVATQNDSVAGPQGEVTVAVASNPDYRRDGVGSRSVAIHDAGAPAPADPTVSFAAATSSAAEDAGSVDVAVNISPAPTSAITVIYTVGGTAASGTDFAALSGSVSVALGITSVNIPVAITDDASDESDETVILTLTSGSGYDVGSTSEHTLTITDNDDPATSAEDSEIPSAFALRQNYPNPFNPSTTIEFSLDKTQHVSLAVYDMLGREVRTLMEGVQPAANHRVSFDASDLPGGAYLYVLRAEEQTAVRKMSLLR